MWRPGGSRAARTSARPRAGHCSGKLRAAHAAVLRRAFLFSSARSDLQRSRPKSARDTLPSSMSRHSAAALGSYRGAADRDERRPKGIKGNHAAYCCQRWDLVGTAPGRRRCRPHARRLHQMRRADLAAGERGRRSAFLPQRRSRALKSSRLARSHQAASVSFTAVTSCLSVNGFGRKANWPCSGRCFWKASSA